MYLDKFPSDIETYFKVLENCYGEGKISLTYKEPWYLNSLKKVFTRLHPDQAVKRYENEKWINLRTLYSQQIARSDKANLEDKQTSHFYHACGVDPYSRGYGQLPCTIKAIKRRVALISEAISKDSPILIIGDDDALSIALAQEGFSDITVFEIDPSVIEKLKKVLQSFPHAKIKLIEQDVFKAIPLDVIREYAMITFDPWYAMDGLEAFMECGVKANSGIQPQILLSFNCGALLSSYKQFEAYLLSKKFKIAKWIPLSNTYPMPKSFKLTIGSAEFLANLLSFEFRLPRINKEMFFSSDLLLIKPIK